MDFETLAKTINGTLTNDRLGRKEFHGVTIDSRTAEESQLFIAIKGENNDGHKYIGDVLKKNIAGVVVNYDFPGVNDLANKIPVVAVPDSHRSMVDLAADYAIKVGAQYIAITGSNGKTTTKEFVYGMIRSVNDRTYRSPGNLNNLYGLPLAIFVMPFDSRYGVFEFGISKPGEMTDLTEIMKPDMVVITNIGPTHLETLGTIEGVAEAKFELADSLDESRPVLINADDPVLMKTAKKRSRKFHTFAVDEQADFKAERHGLDSDGYPLIKIAGETLKLKLFGGHQIYNALAGYAACRLLDLEIDLKSLNDIKYTFAQYRGEIENINNLTIIADCYNANPDSMNSGLQSFKKYLNEPSLSGRRSIAVIGDMLELGKESVRHHRTLGEDLAKYNFDLTVTVGEQSRIMYDAAIESGVSKENIVHCKDSDAAGEILMNNILRGDIIYLKASRGIGLEKLIILLKGAAFRQN